MTSKTNNKPLRPVDELASFVKANQPLFVLTGAGCSTASGLADYRDQSGQWKRPQPITLAAFTGDLQARKRYWMRSTAGWPVFSAAQPNAAHNVLARLEKRGYLQQLVTQNVDGLHQSAGHKKVIDLHGQLSTVSCLSCAQTQTRKKFQQQLLECNPQITLKTLEYAPDGDAEIAQINTNSFHIPECNCGGIIKPDVVFFGENVPRQRVSDAMAQLQHAAGVLVAGSSLMVYSGFRFCRRAEELHLPIASLTLGVTRADSFLTLNVQGECTTVLTELDRLLP